MSGGGPPFARPGPPCRDRRGAPSDREGFILAVVVFLLFSIGVAAAAGYQVVATEFTLASDTRDGQEAVVVARAGLERFLAEQLGVVGDSVSYAVGSGVATITTRKVFELDSLNHMYYVASEGNVADLRRPADPARRVVGAYAWHRVRPVPHRGAVMLTGGGLVAAGDFDANGFDQTSNSTCAGGGTSGIPGVATAGTVSRMGGEIDGNPGTATFYSGYAEVMDTVGLRWDVLQDPSFPVEFEGTPPPSFASMPADSFPVWRLNGDHTVTSYHSGRGVLVVTGRLTLSTDFRWQGIVLAGTLSDVANSTDPRIFGMLIAGLDGGQPDIVLSSGRVRYNSCNVYAANESLSRLDRIAESSFEAN